MTSEISRIENILLNNLSKQIALSSNLENQEMVFTDICSKNNPEEILIQVISGNVFNKESQLYKNLGIHIWIPTLDEDACSKFESTTFAYNYKRKDSVGFLRYLGMRIDWATNEIYRILNEYYGLPINSILVCKQWDTSDDSLEIQHSFELLSYTSESLNRQNNNFLSYTNQDIDIMVDNTLGATSGKRERSLASNPRGQVSQPISRTTKTKLSKKEIRSQLSKTKKYSKYGEAYTYIKYLIQEGKKDNEILEIFNSKHVVDPEHFSTRGGRELSKNVLKRFREAVVEYEHQQSILTEGRRKQTQMAKESKENSIGYQWVKERLEEGWEPMRIVKEFNLLRVQEPNSYSTRTGKPLTMAILCNWEKELFPNKSKKNKSIQAASEWRKNSPGYQWVKEQVMRNIPDDDILMEFNNRHSVDPGFSGKDGGPLRIGTIQKWRIEILTHKYE